MANCPCNAENEFETCCEPLIKGVRMPESAEELLRSRFSAYATKDIDYVINTTHPQTRGDLVRSELEEWAHTVEWKELVVNNADTEGHVEFSATYRENGEVRVHRELSTFKEHDGQWYFFDSAYPKGTSQAKSAKVGRNDPCPCKSGKKFKKCCGNK